MGSRGRLGRVALEVVFGVALLAAASAAAADLWGSDRSYYASFAAEAQLDRTPFHSHFPLEGAELRLTLGQVLAVDDATRSFVLCGDCFFDSSFPAGVAGFYGREELAHLGDVRGVLTFLVRVVAPVGAIVAVASALALSRRRIRRAALVGAGAVVAVGALAAVSFDWFWLYVFHPLLFPQGNYLFDPARENLVLLYPDGYWLGVSLRFVATVTATCLIVGALLALPIRSRRGAH